jgi:hypothetical protein
VCNQKGRAGDPIQVDICGALEPLNIKMTFCLNCHTSSFESVTLFSVRLSLQISDFNGFCKIQTKFTSKVLIGFKRDL